MEATTVTGPAKNLIQFCRRARHAADGLQADVTIATFCRGSDSNQFVTAVRAAGIEIDTIAERFRLDTSVIGQLASVVKRRAPDIIQTHGVKSHFLVNRFRIGRGRRWIAYHHGYTNVDWKMRLYDKLDRWSLPAADRVITVCRPFLNQLAATGVSLDRLRVLPNSIDAAPAASAEAMASLRLRLGLTLENRVVLSVGRFSQEKGHIHLVRAASRVIERRGARDVHFVFVGAGPELEAVRGAAIGAGLADIVHFEGQQRDVGPYFGIAHCFVLPSYSEGSPNALLEAMAARVPAVATSVGGVPEMVRHEESALLTAPGDSVAIADAILRVLEDGPLAERLASAAAADIAAYHHPEAYRRSLVGIYNELCN